MNKCLDWSKEKLLLSLKYLSFLFFISSVITLLHTHGFAQSVVPPQSKARYTITYNSDGSATVVGESQWRNTSAQMPCPSSSDIRTDKSWSAIKTTWGRDGKCYAYSLTFIPTIKELSELPVNDLPA